MYAGVCVHVCVCVCASVWYVCLFVFWVGVMLQGQVTYFEVVKDGRTSKVLSCTTAWSMLVSLGARGVYLGAIDENLTKSTLKGPVTSGGGALAGGSAGVCGVSSTSSDVLEPKG